jgi:RNA polymerase primary sigma factor
MISDFEFLSAAHAVAHRTAPVSLVSGFCQGGPSALAPCLPKPEDVRRGLGLRGTIPSPSVPHAPVTAAPAHPKEPARLSGREDFVLDLYLRDVSAAMRSGCADVRGRDSVSLFDDGAREQLVLGGLHDVVRIAMGYRGMGLPVADLINEGNIGLIRAAELYDPNRCVRFAHYAQPWIRVQMQRALSYQAWPVNFPADFAWRHGKVCRTEQSLKASLDRAPLDSEVASACGMGVRTVHRLRATPMPRFVPLDTPFPADEPGVTLGEVLPDENTPGPDKEAERHSDRQMLVSLMRILPVREQKVLQLRYGLNDGRPRTLQEVARALGYVRQGIHRLENAALTRLRKHARFLLRSSKVVRSDRALNQACPPGTAVAQCATPLLAG